MSPEQRCHLFIPELATGISSIYCGSAPCSACLCSEQEQLCLTASQSLLLNTIFNTLFTSGQVQNQEKHWKDWESAASTKNSVLGLEPVVVSGRAGWTRLSTCLFVAEFLNQAVKSQKCDEFGFIFCGCSTWHTSIFTNCCWKWHLSCQLSSVSTMPQAWTGLYYFKQKGLQTSWRQLQTKNS